MASIQQFFVTLNAATADLFARFHKRTDRHLLRQAINPSAAMLRSGLKMIMSASLDRRIPWFVLATQLEVKLPLPLIDKMFITYLEDSICMGFLLFCSVCVKNGIYRCRYHFNDTESSNFAHIFHMWRGVIMMTSSNGSFFRVTGTLWGEFTGHRWIPRTKASDAKLWWFLWSAPE